MSARATCCGPQGKVRHIFSKVLCCEWTPFLFSPQTVQRAVCSGNLNRFPGTLPLCSCYATVSKRNTGSCALRPAFPEENHLCSCETALHSTLSQGLSIRNPLKSTKARMIQPSRFSEFKECFLSLSEQCHHRVCSCLTGPRSLERRTISGKQEAFLNSHPGRPQRSALLAGYS